jgi:hypothetical protein
VRYILTEPGRRLPSGFEHLYSGPDGELYLNPRALPRFFVPERLTGRTRDALAVQLGRIPDHSRLAVVETLEAGQERANGSAVVTAIDDDGFGRFRLRIDAGTDAFVVSSLPSVPGWRLEIDGHRAALETVNGAFVGFDVPAGTRSVELRYHPRSFDIGIGLAAAGWLMLVFVGRRYACHSSI